MQHTKPPKQRLVLLGGGHSHAIVLRLAAMKPLPETELVLVSDGSRSAYSGMLPGFVQGYYQADELMIDLRRLAQACGAVFIEASATGLDLVRREVLFQTRPPLPFDVLSLNIGAVPDLTQLVGGDRHGVPVKPIAPFLADWQRLVERAQLRPDAVVRVVLGGGGAGGVELALAMAARLGPRAQVTLVHGGAQLLPEFPRQARTFLMQALVRHGVCVRTGSPIAGAEPSHVRLANGERLPYDALYWTTAARAPAWLATTGLAVDERGFLRVDATLTCVGQRAVFAAGDCASIVDQPRSKAGVFAVREGRPLFVNLRRSLSGAKLHRVRLQKRYLALVGTGDGRAVGARYPLAMQGRWIWRWKERIDRRFMATLASAVTAAAMPPQPMAKEEAAREAMRCQGCGAKVGGSVLAEALARLTRDTPDLWRDSSLLWGLAEREDVSVWTPKPGQSILQSLDFFPSLVRDPYLAGQIACIHAFSDVIVKGATPHSAQVLAVLPPASAHLQSDQLYQLLAGIASQLRLFGAMLIGGHTAEGEQLAVGLMVNGLASSRLLRKDGGREGDALILTKPLGTGLIFAAAMRGQAKAPWIDAAIASMLQTQYDLSPLLADADVHAATDVTGFGLAGHLSEMLRSTPLTAHLNLNAVPRLPGVEEVIRRGIGSTLLPANRRFFAQLRGQPCGGAEALLAPLWADPQTCGGFLLSVAPAAAIRLVAAMRAAGYTQAAVIGRLGSDQPHSV